MAEKRCRPPEEGGEAGSGGWNERGRRKGGEVVAVWEQGRNAARVCVILVSHEEEQEAGD